METMFHADIQKCGRDGDDYVAKYVAVMEDPMRRIQRHISIHHISTDIVILIL